MPSPHSGNDARNDRRYLSLTYPPASTAWYQTHAHIRIEASGKRFYVEHIRQQQISPPDMPPDQPADFHRWDCIAVNADVVAINSQRSPVLSRIR
ncbi:hypothetical protein OHD27_00010 [Escherichia coli]|nr:hypothetical protein [Escherichia coli]